MEGNAARLMEIVGACAGEEIRCRSLVQILRDSSTRRFHVTHRTLTTARLWAYSNRWVIRMEHRCQRGLKLQPKQATSRHPNRLISPSWSCPRSTPDRRQNLAATNTYALRFPHPCCASIAKSELRLSGAKSKRTLKALQIKLSLSTVPIHPRFIDVLITPKLLESGKICGPSRPGILLASTGYQC